VIKGADMKTNTTRLGLALISALSLTGLAHADDASTFPEDSSIYYIEMASGTCTINWISGGEGTTNGSGEISCEERSVFGTPSSNTFELTWSVFGEAFEVEMDLSDADSAASHIFLHDGCFDGWQGLEVGETAGPGELCWLTTDSAYLSDVRRTR